MIKIKIIVIGPCKSGKTAISNILSEAIDNPEIEYHPTQGVRILEYESINPMSGTKTEVELWDSSGDPKFDACWPAFVQGIHGIMLVMDTSRPEHIRYAERLLGLVNHANLNADQCLVLLTSSSNNNPAAGVSKLSGNWSQAHHCKSDLKEGGPVLRREVASFVSQLAEAARAHSDKEDLNLLGLR